MNARFATAIAVALGVSLWSLAADAQACCAAAQSSGPTRLSVGQLATVGVGADVKRNSGVFAGTSYRSMNRADYEFRQTGFGALAIGEQLQVGATVPFIRNRIRVKDGSESGGGLGDMALQIRYQLLEFPPRTLSPDLGVFASVTAPTGRSRTESIAQSEGRLQADVTGDESWRFGGGVQAEWAWVNWFFTSEVSAFWRPSYEDATGDSVNPGVGMRTRVGIGRILFSSASMNENLVAGAGISHGRQGRDRRSGSSVANSDERLTSVDVHLGGHITKNLHAMVKVSTDLRLEHTGKNRYAGSMIGLALRGVLTDY